MQDDARSSYRVEVHPSDIDGVLAELEVHFTGGPLDGTKLVGFQVRRGNNDGTFVTFPARAWGAGTERRYYDFLRSTASDRRVARLSMARVARWLKDAWKKEVGDEAN